jgi:hypothetical protein
MLLLISRELSTWRFEVTNERNTVYGEQWVKKNETVILQNGFMFWNPYKFYTVYIHSYCVEEAANVRRSCIATDTKLDVNELNK